VALRGLRRRVGAAGAVLLSALAFGLQHWAFAPLDWQFGLVRFASLGAVGVIFGLVALRQDRLLSLIIGHTVWNVLLIGLPALLATSGT
jgi:membrane protease YdiL (CAAX protease family)